MGIEQEASRRRTFAIISHPDAGKTTLTEKLLLYAGAIHIAGTVKARKSSRHATSDWMAIEKQRGISVASSVMQMEYRDCVINLLDTPGHQDFSEDTNRVLTAVDAELLMIDGGKGVVSQSLRLLKGEGDIAGPLGTLAARHPEVSIGSYPFHLNGVHGTNIVVRSQDGPAVDRVMAALSDIFGPGA